MRIFIGIALVFLVATGLARAEMLPEQRPFLRVDAGMHTAPIMRISVDAACTMMATGSDDKTARLWSLPAYGQGAPQLIRTFRVPTGDGNDGKIFAVALSPDGKWLAAGGWDARYSIDQTIYVYVFEAATGRLITRVGGFSNVVNHLTFSADGTRLAAMVFGGLGMHQWSTSDWRQIAEDMDYGGKDSYGAAFDSANRLFTVSYDGYLRRYDASGRLSAKAATVGAKMPYSVAIHPGGTKIAVGFEAAKEVEVYSTENLARLYVVDTNKISSDGFRALAWSPDGSQLYAAGWVDRNDATNPVVFWAGEGRGRRSEVPMARNTIMGVFPCGAGFAFGAQDPALGVITADGSNRLWQGPVSADVRDMNETLRLAANGKTVQFGLQQFGKKAVRFDLATFQLASAPGVQPGLVSAKTSGLRVTDWKHTQAPKLNGRPITLDQYEHSRALAVAPDASLFVLGADYWLRAFRADGTVLWTKPIPNVAWGVNISPDGRLVVAAYGDGTIRWHRLSDGQELLALFVHAQDQRFVAWTPQGYYAASPGSEGLIGWHVNRDWDHAPDFYPAAQFRDLFNRPDIVKRVLDDLDEEVAIAEANRRSGSRAPNEIGKSLPPVITILSPAAGENFNGGPVTVRYSVRSPSGLAVTEIAALADGRPVPGGTTRGPSIANSKGETEGTIVLSSLPQHDVLLSLQARAGDVESTQESVRLVFAGAPPPPPPSAATGPSTAALYGLIVGVSKFKDTRINSLDWAAKDARDFAAALKRQEGRLYRKVEIKLLADEDADNGAILDGLTWLKRQVSQGDVGVVFLAGHGVTDPGGDYYYVPFNARMEEVGGVPLPTRSSSVPDSEISRALKQLAGNALFFFDTCHAGKAAGISFRGEQDYNKVINEIAGSANAVVLASSTGTELSQEREEWKQGAFTKALLEGLAGAADILPKDGIITVDELNLYVKERVKELTGGLQHPVDLKPKEARNFPFAVAR